MNENNENPIEKLLDVDNNEPITLYDEKDNGIKFEQIALIPFQERLYAMLKPAEKMEGVEDDEAVIFVFEEDEQDNAQYLKVVNDDKIIDKVFAIYLNLLKEEDEPEEKKTPEKKETVKTEKKAPAKTTSKPKVEKKPVKTTAKKTTSTAKKPATAKKTTTKAQPKKTIKK